MNEQIETELDKNDANQEQQRANIVNILQSHLGEVTQTQTDFVHQLVQPNTGGASSSTAIAPVIKPTKQSKKNTGEPETTHPGKRGRKSNAEKQLQQQAVEDVDMPQQSTPEKRKQTSGG